MSLVSKDVEFSCASFDICAKFVAWRDSHHVHPNAHAKVEKLIADVQFPGNRFELGIIENDFWRNPKNPRIQPIDQVINLSQCYLWNGTITIFVNQFEEKFCLDVHIWIKISQTTFWSKIFETIINFKNSPSVSIKPVDCKTSSKLIFPSPSASNKNENIFDSISSVPLFSKKSEIGTAPFVILPSN